MYFVSHKKVYKQIKTNGDKIIRKHALRHKKHSPVFEKQTTERMTTTVKYYKK